MSNALKGALYSGLIFPGLGQVVFKHYRRGVVLMVTVSVLFMVMAFEAVQQALNILQKMELEGSVIDLKTVAAAATQASSTSGSLVYSLGYLFAACWIFGIADAYIIGRKIDLDGNGSGINTGCR